MTAPTTTFRLLDDRVGWDPRAGDGLTQVVIDAGALQLAGTGPAGYAAAGTLTARLSRSRGDGAWWLADRTGLRRLAACDEQFVPWQVLRRVRAVGADLGTVGIVQNSGAIVIFDTATAAVVGRAHIPGAVAIRGTGRGFVVHDHSGADHSIDPSGLICQSRPGCAPGTAVPPAPNPLAGLAPGLAIGADGFCIAGRGCFDWRGRPLPASNLAILGDGRQPRGQYLSLPLDSGIPGCRWHRVRIDADVPDGCLVEAAVATTDGPADGRISPVATAGPWQPFPTGDPHPDDWYPLGSNVTDNTLRVAPGRYAYLRIRLTGDGRSTPRVHQVRLDLPRHGTLDLLPAVYAEEPAARDFSERFLSLFDAHLERLDDLLDRRPALFDGAALPDDALGWLGGLIGVGFEPQMTIERRRALLAAAPDLYRRRGTPGGLVDTLRIALGVSASLEEPGTARPWGAVGQARLGSVRLFGRSRARVLLGSSVLGRARIHSGGDPDHDAVLSGAGRLRVFVGLGADLDVATRVVRSQSPAPVLVSVRAARPGFVVGGLRVGVDTMLTSPAPAVVGSVVLRRSGVLGGGRHGPGITIVGRSTVAPFGARPTGYAASVSAFGDNPCEDCGTE